jgi:hypothetical protein
LEKLRAKIHAGLRGRMETRLCRDGLEPQAASQYFCFCSRTVPDIGIEWILYNQKLSFCVCTISAVRNCKDALAASFLLW